MIVGVQAERDAAEMYEPQTINRNGCAYPGCGVRFFGLGLKVMKHTLQKHYCSRCQNLFCHHHTQYSPHGSLGSCGLDSKCICLLCWQEIPPSRQVCASAGIYMQMLIPPPLVPFSPPPVSFFLYASASFLDRQHLFSARHDAAIYTPPPPPSQLHRRGLQAEELSLTTRCMLMQSCTRSSCSWAPVYTETDPVHHPCLEDCIRQMKTLLGLPSCHPYIHWALQPACCGQDGSRSQVSPVRPLV